MKQPTLYLIPGLLTNEVLYKNFRKEIDLPTKVLEFIPAKKYESIESYAKRLSEGIDTSEPFYLLGTSFGGLLAIEMTKFVCPEKLILVSSAKNRSEFNWSMKQKRMGSIIPYIPAWIIRIIFVWGFIIATFFSKSYKRISNPEIREMIKSTDGKFERWVIRKFTLWDGLVSVENLIHIHGDSDKVFPSKKIKKAIIIKNASHSMMLTHTNEIATIVNQYTLACVLTS